MPSLYDRADLYDAFETERKYQQTILHWKKVLEGTNIKSFLDVSIGTGSLTLPLAELGIELYGSDISQTMLDRCAKKANNKNISIELTQCDFRKVGCHFNRKFDCVASTGNSLPYVTNSEVSDVIEQMDSLVNENGYIYIDTRNWDKILVERKRFWPYNPTFINGTRINCVQLWDYNMDGSMDFNILYSFEDNGVITSNEIFEEHYFPIKRNDIVNKLKNIGYGNIRIMCMPAFADFDVDSFDWYCIIAQKQNI